MTYLFRIFILLLCFGLQLPVLAQYNNADTALVNKTHRKGWSFRNSNPDSVLYYGEKELQAAQSIQYKIGIANATTLLAIFYQYQANYDKTLTLYNKALSIYKEEKAGLKIAATLTNIGSIYLRKSQYTEAIQFFNRALEIRIKWGDSLSVSSSYSNLGLAHTELGNFDTGLEFLYHSLRINQGFNDQYGVAQCHNNIAINYYEQENMEDALHHYQRALKLFELLENKRGIAEVTNNIGEVLLQKNETDYAMEHFETAIEIFEELGHKKGVVTIFKNMAWVNYYDGELYKARRNCLHALRENISMSDKEGEADVLLLMGKIELEDQKPADAIDYLTEAFNIAYQINSKKYIKDASEALSNAYSELEDYKNANRYLQLYASIKDSLLSSEKVRTIARLNANYELEKQKNELTYKTNEIELLVQAQSLERQRTVALGGAVAMLVVVGLLIFLRVQYNQKKKRELLQKDKQLAETQKALMEAELKNTQLAGEDLKTRLDFKNNEIQNFALHIIEKNEFISEISKQIEQLKTDLKDPIAINKVRDISAKVKYSQSIDRERQEFQKHIEQLNSEFFLRLEKRFPTITESEKKLTALLRLGLSSKEIASILNISAKSVDMNRYRLRKKFEIQSDDILSNFISKI